MSILSSLAAVARAADESAVWPEASWQLACQLGATRWAIPKIFGGDELAGIELLTRHEELAASCLTTCFILSQRDAAVRRLLTHGDDALCRELLPPLASGERFATVGLSQLSTSRQFGKPTVVAESVGDDWRIDGTIPWVTGATRAEHIVIGAVVGPSEQILVVLSTELPGVTIGPSLPLAALEGSLTAEVRLEAVRVPGRWLLAGPVEQVMRGGERGGTGGLETSCLALGLASAAVSHLRHEASVRPELTSLAEHLQTEQDALRSELLRLAEAPPHPQAAQDLRARANAHVLRATQAALAISKGTGYLRDHPAQRWARQALFFLVWSCPWPVTAATMSDIVCTS